MEEKRVVVIQDASKHIVLGAIRWAIDRFSLQPGDKLTLLGVLHQNNISLEISSICLANQRIADAVTANKKEEFESNAELIKVSKVCEEQKVQFNVEVVAGPSPKAVALKSAKILKATWVILDRKMKKERSYFLERLSCGISRMKRNGDILPLREPKEVNVNRISFEEQHRSHVSYEEMMPSTPEEEEDLFSIELSPTSQNPANAVIKNQELMGRNSVIDSNEGWEAQHVFGNSKCTTCNNRRPHIEWRKDFSYQELEAATNGFSSENNISEGGSGSTFRGQLESKLSVVIKKSKAQEETKFKSQIDRLSRVRHNNLLMLLGCCTEGSQRLLVYEYPCNGSLHQCLSKQEPSPLTWTERIRIALGAARGLNHLHQNNIFPNTISPRKILLNHDFEPMIGDFGMVTTKSELMPAKNEKMLTKTDVYSFGVILLELITGQMIEQKALVVPARSLLKQRRYLELADARISCSLDIHQLFRVAQLAQKCLSKNPNKRLPMDEMVSILENVSKSGCKDEDYPPLFRTLEPARYNQHIDAKSSFTRSFSTSSTAATERSFGSSSSSGKRSFKLMRRWRSNRETKVSY